MNQSANSIISRSEEDIVSNIKTIISSPTWNLETVKDLVRLNSSFINEPIFEGKTLLQVMVCDARGTDDIVSFLIDHNADLTLSSDAGTKLYRCTTLLLEAMYECEERPEIVKVLLQRGANIKDEKGSRSALSMAVRYYGTDILEMIIKRGADPNYIDLDLKSAICIALNYNREIEVFELLLAAGASVSACQKHKSPLHCIEQGCIIRSDIVRLMLRNGAKGGNVIIDDKLNRTVIHSALTYCIYETDAMKSLILSESVDVNAPDYFISTMLHDALFNMNCKLGLVKLLIDLGSRVDSVNCAGDTPLHSSVSHLVNPDFVRLLLKHGSPVNVTNREDKTALHIAVQKRQSLEILRLLLSSGERIFKLPFPIYPQNSMLVHTIQQHLESVSHIISQLLQYDLAQPLETPAQSLEIPAQPLETIAQSLASVVKRVHYSSASVLCRLTNESSPIMSVALEQFACNKNPENLNRFQTLLKFLLLENPMIDILGFIKMNSTLCDDPVVWVRFWYECLKEIERMLRKRMPDGQKFIDIVENAVVDLKKNSYDILTDRNNRYLLITVSNREFSLYSDIIASKIGYDFLKEEFLCINLCVIKSTDLANNEVRLNNICIEYLGKFLSFCDLVNMILVFHRDYKQM